MTTISDLLTKQRDHIELIKVCERRKAEYTCQIEGHESKLKEVHKELMRPILNEIKKAKS